MWHDSGHSFCGCGCGWAPVRGFLGLFLNEIHKKGRRGRFTTKLEEDEEKQGLKAGLIGLSGSQGKATVREGQLLKEEFGLVDPEVGSPSARGGVSVPGCREGISLGYTLTIVTEPQMHRNVWKVTKTYPFLRLGLTQMRSCLFFFFPPSVIYDISAAYL